MAPPHNARLFVKAERFVEPHPPLLYHLVKDPPGGRHWLRNFTTLDEKRAGCRGLSFKQDADTASSRRVKILLVDIAMGAMHPVRIALIPAPSIGSDVLKAATLTCVVAAMLTGILLCLSSFVCPVERTSAAFWSVQPCPMHSAAQRGASGRRGGRESAAGGGLRRPLHGSARVLFAVAPAIQMVKGWRVFSSFC